MSLRIAAVDVGAESGRVVVGEYDGSRLRLADVARFPNVPVRLAGTLYWDFLRLFDDITGGLGRAGPLASLGVDTWGVDFGLLDARGRLLANPVHYRDARTSGLLDRVDRRRVYATTGIQFMEINTLYQLLAEPPPPTARLLLMPDLVHHFLCGSTCSEYTNATTTQCLDASRRTWALDMLAELGLPASIFPEIVPPGTVLGTYEGARVIAPGTHDTASAVASIPLEPDAAYLSSGTWSLLGLEIERPILTEQARLANATNEGGVGGRIRLLKNVMGLWLVQQARAALPGQPGYDELTTLAETAPSMTALVDPDHARLLRTADVRNEIAALCRETRQPAPQDDGTLVRVILESLALKYAAVLRQLQDVSGRAIERLRVVGGGANNALLCQLTADATGLPVEAGLSEATAAGNVLVQAIALGELASLDQAREVVRRSFEVRRFEPRADWSEARARFDALIAPPREAAIG